MKVNIGVYSKNKNLPQVYGPRRRVKKGSVTRKVIKDKKTNGIGRGKKNLIFILIIAFFGLIAFLIVRFNSYQSRVDSSGESNGTVCANIFNPQCWTDVFKPTLKQTDGFTNALIVGVDTRPSGSNSNLMNTDSIIIFSINNKLKKVMVISIPRDMLIDVKIKGKYCCTMKINSIYSLQSARSDVPDGLELLAQNIEEKLGIKIHYRGSINFDAVKDGVDAVGGVTINIKDKVVAEYPEENPPENIKLYEFLPGEQKLDGKRALVWGRFRHIRSGPVEYASDFSRSERQQQIISALKDKVLADNSNITDSARKYWDIYQTLSKNIKVSSVSFEDVLAGFSLINDYDRDPLNVVLDPNFGGVVNRIIHHPPTTDQFGYYIIPKDNTWAAVRKELTSIWSNADIYRDEATVVVSNRTGKGFGTDSQVTKLQSQNLPFGGFAIYTESATKSGGVKIFDFSGGKKNRTIEYLKTIFTNATVITDPLADGIKVSAYKEDIRIEVNPEVKVSPTTSTDN